MRAAERLVRELAPPGLEIPIPEPLALDESTWFLVAVDKGLIEFTRCPQTCERGSGGAIAARDHFVTSGGEARHLFELHGGHPRLQRDYVPCLASYARAVYDFAYDPERASLLGRRPIRRLVNRHASGSVHTDVAFAAADGAVHLQIKSLGDRQRTRRLATALDACGRRSGMTHELEREFDAALAGRPRFLWLVGPNSIDPARHVFELSFTDGDVRFTRVDAVPVPAGA